MRRNGCRPGAMTPRELSRPLASMMLAAVLLVLSALAVPAQEQIRVIDIAGREVVLSQPARRIVLGAWVSLDALSLLHPEPVSLLAGWANGGANGIQPKILRSRFPAIDTVPVIGRDAFETISAEAIIARQPDLLVLSKFDAFRFGASSAETPALKQIEAAGIPVVIVDFFLEPLRNTEPSLRALGRLIGREAQAEAYLTFYREHLKAIEAQLQSAGKATPSVFLHAFAARPDCCFSAGPGTIDGFIRLAGGHNIAAETLTTPIGQLSIEHVLTRNPDIYIATGISDQADAGGFALGPGVSPQTAAAGFARLLERRHLAPMQAITRKRAFGLWHLFVHTPVHLVAIEAMAKWLRPDVFDHLDPGKTLDEINARFLAAPLVGTFWVESREFPGGRSGRP